MVKLKNTEQCSMYVVPLSEAILTSSTPSLPQLLVLSKGQLNLFPLCHFVTPEI